MTVTKIDEYNEDHGEKVGDDAKNIFPNINCNINLKKELYIEVVQHQYHPDTIQKNILAL